MVRGLPRPPSDNDSRPALRSLEALMAAPTVDTPDTLLSERGEMERQLGRRLSMPLAELIDHLRGGDA